MSEFDLLLHVLLVESLTDVGLFLSVESLHDQVGVPEQVLLVQLKVLEGGVVLLIRHVGLQLLKGFVVNLVVGLDGGNLVHVLLHVLVHCLL